MNIRWLLVHSSRCCSWTATASRHRFLSSAHMASASTHSRDTSVGDLTNLGLFHSKPNGEAHRVLVVGDGNFSFARAFLQSNTDAIASGAVALTATSLDTHDELLQMYPNSGVILDELHNGGVRVVHDVNATKLQQYPALLHTRASATADAVTITTPALLFDRIVFNFPHYAEGGSKRNKIHRHRQLLREFFVSAQDVLAQDGLVWVTLCAGQGGTPLDTKPRAFGDTWQVAHCAAAAGFIARSVHLCPVQELAVLGYYSVGYKLKEQAFWTPDSLSHVFCREGLGVRACFPLTWTRGMSFWTHDGFTEAKMAAIVRACFPEPVALTFELTDTYVCPTTGRTSVTYSVGITCDCVALSKERVNEWTLDAIARIERSGFASSRAQ